MAIAINGSGTITGISQGGLNDNIITKNEMATGGAWAPAGTVLQVVEGVTGSETFTNSTSYVTTNLSASITPSSSTNKILIIVSSTIYAANAANGAEGTVYRNGSDIANSYFAGPLFLGEGGVFWAKCCTTLLDSPASTSALTYTLYIKTTNATYSAAANRNNTRNSIILMEIAA